MRFNKIVFATILLITSLQSVSQIKVACIGDSITEGSGLTTDQTYPTQLQKLMKSPYEVRNYGHAGSSLLDGTRMSYRDKSKYKTAMDWAPDVIIIKLGTNDSKEEFWAGRQRFYEDYISLINSFKSLPNKPKIYICYPLPSFKNRFGIREEIVKKEIIPIVKQVAKETEVSFIDVYTPFYSKSHLLLDGVHPNATGAEFLAMEIFKAIGK